MTPDFEKLVALLTPALIGVSLIFKIDGIRAGVKGAGVKGAGVKGAGVKGAGVKKGRRKKGRLLCFCEI